MKLVKYMIGSLIISFGILFVIAIVLRAIQIDLPSFAENRLLLIWIGLALLILPFAKKIIRT